MQEEKEYKFINIANDHKEMERVTFEQIRRITLGV